MGTSACGDATDALSSAVEQFEKTWDVDMSGFLDELELLVRVESIMIDQNKEGGVAELMTEVYNSFAKRLKQHIYIEVKTRIQTQISDMISALMMRTKAGSSANLCKDEEDQGSGSS